MESSALNIATPAAAEVRRAVELALAEDIGSGDATAGLIPAETRATATVVTREAAVLCGRPWFDACFRALDPDVVIEWRAADGDRVGADQTLCVLTGFARALLSAERCALNFLQTLSGTATVTRSPAKGVWITSMPCSTVPGVSTRQ